MPGTENSYWKPPFLGAMLVLGKVILGYMQPVHLSSFTIPVRSSTIEAHILTLSAPLVYAIFGAFAPHPKVKLKENPPLSMSFQGRAVLISKISRVGKHSQQYLYHNPLVKIVVSL